MLLEGERGNGMRFSEVLCQETAWIEGQVGMLFQIANGHGWG